MNAKEILTWTTEASILLKAMDLVQIDLEGKSSISEFMFVCSGSSTVNVKGIAEKISMDLKEKGLYPLNIEGISEGNWIVMDYDSVIVHIFTEETRKTYQIEDLYRNSRFNRIKA